MNIAAPRRRAAVELLGLSDRLTDTTWACRWISLNAPLSDYPAVSSRVEVDHTLSFTATTMTDDLPDRLYEWATASPDTYAKAVAYGTGFNSLGTAEVSYTMDEVTWTPVSDDELLFCPVPTIFACWHPTVAPTFDVVIKEGRSTL